MIGGIIEGSTECRYGRKESKEGINGLMVGWTIVFFLKIMNIFIA